MKRSFSIKALLLILIGVLYVVVSLLGGLITDFSVNFFWGLGFFTFSTAVTSAIVSIYTSKKINIQAIIFHVPIYYLSVYYFVICAIIDFFHMIFGTYSTKATFIVQIIVLTVFAVLFILSLIHVNVSKNTYETVKEKNSFIRDSVFKMNTLISKCSDTKLKKHLDRVCEDIKYSPPATDRSLTDIEAEISKEIEALNALVDDNNIDGAKAVANAIKEKMASRNEKVKILTK